MRRYISGSQCLKIVLVYAYGNLNSTLQEIRTEFSILFSELQVSLPSPIKQCPREKPGRLYASWG